MPAGRPLSSGSAHRNITHYDRLGIRPPSDPKTIKSSYLKRAKECHPDIHGPSKTQEFQEVSQAFTVLSNPQSKAAYDASLSQTARNHGAKGAQAGRGRNNHAHQPSDMDLDRAVEIFRRAWAESAAAEYFATVERDVITSMHQARKTGPQPLIDLAYRRRGLVMAVIAPAILLFRFPWLAIGALRVMRSVGVWVLAILLRDPMLSSWLLTALWRQVARALRERGR